jgi:aldehyde:ferredoxin oxidoreductase
LAECLAAVGFDSLAGSIPEVAEHIRRLRWQTRIATGFDPEALTIPKRFYDVRTWKGPVSREYLDALKQEYGRRILRLAADRSGSDAPLGKEGN